MAKVQSFADKMSKGSKDFSTHCPQCGESYQTIKYITTEMSEKTQAMRFNQRFVGLCKCNENDINNGTLA